MNAPTRRAAVIAALGVFVASGYLLLTGSPLLLVTAIEAIGLPLGNVIAWTGMASLPLATYLGFHSCLDRDTSRHRALRIVARVLVALGAAWGFVSYGLAANWAYNFSVRAGGFRGGETAAMIFWGYSFAVVALTLLLAIVLFVLCRLSRSR